MSGDRELAMRRASTRNSIAVGSHHGLQQDIDRLFSQKFRIFEPVPPYASLEFIVNTIIKVRI